MKLLVAITVAEYRAQLEQFFSQHQVGFYNEFELKGVRKMEQPPHRVGNWFGQGRRPINNIAFFSMVDDNQADNLLIDLLKCKKDMPGCDIHAYVINVEKGV